jgi:hypothetical protein
MLLFAFALLLFALGRWLVSAQCSSAITRDRSAFKYAIYQLFIFRALFIVFLVVLTL